MSDLPCENCITLAMCIDRSFYYLYRECSILQVYVRKLETEAKMRYSVVDEDLSFWRTVQEFKDVQHKHGRGQRWDPM
jgi:hypothetical protein